MVDQGDPRQVGECLAGKERKSCQGVELHGMMGLSPALVFVFFEGLKITTQKHHRVFYLVEKKKSNLVTFSVLGLFSLWNDGTFSFFFGGQFWTVITSL